MGEHFFVEIREEPTGFELQIHRGDPGKPLLVSALDVAESTPVGNGSLTLGELTRKLVEAKAGFLETFHERPQLDVGHYLYQETFGQLDLALPSEGDVRVHVVTDNEHVARLPWVLLARDGHFLSASG